MSRGSLGGKWDLALFLDAPESRLTVSCRVHSGGELL